LHQQYLASKVSVVAKKFLYSGPKSARNISTSLIRTRPDLQLWSEKNTNLRINFACALFSDSSFDTRETCTNTLQASRNVVQNSTFDCDTVCGFVSTGAGGQSTVTLSCQGSRPYPQYSLAYIVGHYG